MPDLVQAPKELDPNAIENRISSGDWTMCWENHNFLESNFTFLFQFKNNQVNFTLKFVGILPVELDTNIIEKFSKKSIIHNDKMSDEFTYTFGEINDQNCGVSNEPINEITPELYHLSDFPRKCLRDLSSPPPTRIFNSLQLCEILKENLSVFYTGAGISAGRVPTMTELEAALGLSKKDKVIFIKTIQSALNDPKTYAEKIKTFFHACLYQEPSSGHYAITELAKMKGTTILTENIDLLHLRTGFEALMPTGNDFLTEETACSLKKINFILCIGLSHDDHHFLSWYKKCNPKGKIISINLDETPAEYLGTEDYYMVGDAQKILPELVKLSVPSEKQTKQNLIISPQITFTPNFNMMTKKTVFGAAGLLASVVSLMIGLKKRN